MNSLHYEHAKIYVKGSIKCVLTVIELLGFCYRRCIFLIEVARGMHRKLSKHFKIILTADKDYFKYIIVLEYDRYKNISLVFLPF